MNNIENIYNKKTLDILEDIVFIKDPKGFYLFVNKAYCKFANKKRKEIIGKSDYDLFNKEDAKAFRKNDELTIKAKKESVYYESITLNNHDIIYFKSTKNVILDENKNIIATIGTAKNITKQKEYEILYETNQKILEKIIEDASLEDTCNYIINEVEKLNKNMICSILLLDKNEQRFTVGFAPSLPKEYNNAVKTLVIGKGVGSCGTAAFIKQRVIVENIDEHPYWADYTVLTQPLGLHACWSQPFFSKEKDVLGTFAIYYKKAKAPTSFELKLIDSFSYLVSLAVNKRNDIDKIKEKENFLVQQSKLVSIGDMLESISHHWRQPLSVISTIASGLRLEKQLHSEVEDSYDKALEKIIKTTKKLSNTIDQFRNYFIKNHPKEHFFIKTTVDKTLAILDGKFNESNIEFVLDIENLNLNSYENEFIHIFLNLFNNSKDAFELKQIEKRYIFVNIKKINNNCIIEIKDNALGISQEIINRVFEPYFTTKNKAQGIGIGLFTIQDILTRHLKGNIQVQNETYTYQNQEFMGASFTITVPIN